MRAILDVSSKYRGQLMFYSDDPYFVMNCGCRDLLTEDMHIINQDQAYEVCQAVSSIYQLQVTDAALGRLRELTDASDVDTPSFKKPFEEFKFKKFQCRAINVMAEEPNVMLQMSCGCGKTCTSIFMACQRRDKGWSDKIVVWVPAALITDWVKNIESFTNLTVGTVPRGWSVEKRAEWYLKDKYDVWVLNYERVRTTDIEAIKKSLRKKHPIFIFDEVQKLMNRSSRLHREMVKLGKYVKTSSKIALTATPIVKGPENFYNEFRVIEPSIFGYVYDFERLFTYNDGEKTMYGEYIGYQNLPLMHLMAGAQVFSATKARQEIAGEFPQKQETLIPYQLSKQERKVYDEIHKYGQSLNPEDRCGTLFMLTFMRLCNMPEVLLYSHNYPDSEYGEQQRKIDEICQSHRSVLEKSKNSAKLELATEKVDEILSAGEKLIIFAQHTHNCLIPLAEHLKKYNPLMYFGEMGLEEKERAKTLFKTSPDHNLLLMSDAGQVGLNFQECRHLLHYQTPVSHAAYEQRSDRVHRIDTKFDTIDVIRMCAEDTIEEAVEETMQGRRQIAAEMGLGGDFNEYEEVGAISQEDADFLCGF